MILYFDNYITDAGLTPGAPVWAEEIRKGGPPVYHMPSKFDITLYTLASYAVLDWSAVVIKYDIEDRSRQEYFESEVKKLFPKAVIILGRSDSQAKFQESVKLMQKLGDEWVFYAGNNDHPFVGSSEDVLDHCLEKARELKKTHKFVSIQLSQMLEGLGASDPSSLRHDKRWKRMGEDQYCVWASLDGGFFDAIQIVHIGLFAHWFFSKDVSGRRMRFFRSDTVESYLHVPGHIVVVPKKEICSHFDGYSHLAMHGFEKPDELSPPLLIPPGFFGGKIRIAYGYDDYRDGWLNLNPSKKLYCFQDRNGTDLKLSVNDLPLFWKSRIEKIDVNPGADLKALNAAYQQELERRKTAWRASSPLSKVKKAKNKAVWMATQGARRWKNRIGIWSEKPESLERVLDECEPSAEGRIKSLGKKFIYHAIVAGRALAGKQKKKGGK